MPKTRRSSTGKVHFQVDTTCGPRYACNQAVDPFPEKLTEDLEKVTCCNCKDSLGVEYKKSRKIKEAKKLKEIRKWLDNGGR